MEPDDEGFLYPKIDIAVCVQCGLCRKVCAFQNGYDTILSYDEPFVYAVKHKDENVRMTSSSGGAFTAISDFVLKQSGIVYGATFDENMNIVHQRAETKEECETLKGSKYVQSNLKDVYSQVRMDVKTGKYVLFTGTPCQVAGLKTYLGNEDTKNLILCDIVCHGTPSPLIWSEYLNFISRKYSKIKRYYFRYKPKGWKGLNVFASLIDGKELYNTNALITYSRIFYAHYATRPSCHKCKYTNMHRPSDITMADFWGIEKCMPDFDDNKGVSLLLVNTPKGQQVFDAIKNNLQYRDSNVVDCLQPQLLHPSEPSPKRDAFWADYKQLGYEFVVKKYAGYGLKAEVKLIISLVLQKTGLFDAVRKIGKRS